MGLQKEPFSGLNPEKVWPWAILESICHRTNMDTIVDPFLGSSFVQRHPRDYFSYKPLATAKGTISLWL